MQNVHAKWIMHVLNEYKRLVRSSSRIITLISHQKTFPKRHYWEIFENCADFPILHHLEFCEKQAYDIEYRNIKLIWQLRDKNQNETLRNFTFCQFDCFQGKFLPNLFWLFKATATLAIESIDDTSLWPTESPLHHCWWKVNKSMSMMEIKSSVSNP